MPEEDEKKDGEEGKPPPFRIGMADFSNPRPFESRPGVFHPYTFDFVNFRGAAAKVRPDARYRVGTSR